MASVGAEGREEEARALHSPPHTISDNNSKPNSPQNEFMNGGATSPAPVPAAVSSRGRRKQNGQGMRAIHDKAIQQVTQGLASLQTIDSTSSGAREAAAAAPFEVTRGAYLKRNKETITIEGSPLVKAKRRDLRHTPQAFRQQTAAGRGGRGEKRAGNPERPRDSKRMVQVLSFQSQDHNTRDHQENIRRTVLLTGPKGCLRRPETREFLRWADDSKIPPIQLGDLLRSPDALLSLLLVSSRLVSLCLSLCLSLSLSLSASLPMSSCLAHSQRQGARVLLSQPSHDEMQTSRPT
jgi:hypothetical protein